MRQEEHYISIIFFLQFYLLGFCFCENTLYILGTDTSLQNAHLLTTWMERLLKTGRRENERDKIFLL